jgi:hypothetical protein
MEAMKLPNIRPVGRPASSPGKSGNRTQVLPKPTQPRPKPAPPPPEPKK